MTDPDLQPNVIADITDALALGQKIEAIKIYRKATGMGLKESKRFVDQLIPGLIDQDPERFGRLAQTGAGCGSTVLLLATFTCGVVIWLAR